VQSYSVGAVVARYSQNPAGVRVVRRAIEEFGCAAEFVLLDGDRSIVLAAVGPAALQPRDQLAVEGLLLETGSIAQANGRTAGRVPLADGRIGALTIATELDERRRDQLAEYCCELSRTLHAAETDTVDLTNAEAVRILRGLRDTVVTLTPEYDVKWANDAITSLLGFTPSELIGRSAFEIVHPDDISIAVEAATKLSNADRVYRIDVRMLDALGGWVPVSISGVDHTDDPGVNALVLSIRNDERQSETERTLRETRRVSATILQSLTDAVVATDDTGTITIVNQAARRLFSIPQASPLSSLSFEDFPLLDDEGQEIATDEHPLSSSAWSTGEVHVVSPTGVRTVTASRSEVTSELDSFGTVVTFHDITQARSDARELRRRARHDQLTGLANRRYFQERLRLLEASPQPPTIAACFIDLDKFKNVNDVHGHNVGDAVLKATAQRLANQIRDVDILARPGGDEFLVVLVDPESERVAVEIAERMRRALARPFDIDGLRLHLTASVGVAMHYDGCFDEQQVMQQADIALYAAKERGRDRVEVFDETLATVVELEQQRRNLVRDALDQDRLVMYYQPVVDSSGAIIGVEALARCLDHDGRVVEPAAFLQAIDGTSLMMRLDHQGFDQTCRLAARLIADPATAHFTIGANFSAMTIAQPGFAERIIDTINRYGVPARSMCIEVTETAAFDAGPESIDALRRLHGAGIKISLDDFGTGYSSLSHLRDLPLSSVKIDRTFTSALRAQGAERAIASAVKNLADSLGLAVVAEGVETAEDRQAVCDIGVTKMQGWYFARALSTEELLQALGDQRHTLIGA